MAIDQLRMAVLASFMAALAALGSYLFIPIGPVPIVLTNLFILLGGLLLGSRWALGSVCLYLLIGVIGMPVFSGGRGGITPLLGPTGGYLAGYALSAWLTGLISERSGYRRVSDVVAVSIGILAIYALGVPWLKAITHISWMKAMFIGVIPFLPGDAIKGAAAVMLARSIRPILGRQRFHQLS